jgi:hypothetical protein
MALYSIFRSWTIFSFLILYTVCRTPWTGDQSDARPLRTQDNTNIRASSGIRTHDLNVWAGEHSSFLRPHGHCDRRSECTDPCIIDRLRCEGSTVGFYAQWRQWLEYSIQLRSSCSAVGTKAPCIHWYRIISALPGSSLAISKACNKNYFYIEPFRAEFLFHAYRALFLPLDILSAELFLCICFMYVEYLQSFFTGFRVRLNIAEIRVPFYLLRSILRMKWKQKTNSVSEKQKSM